ncbi:M24 family metallopeptidase [Bradyrhizobium elkanii]
MPISKGTQAFPRAEYLRRLVAVKAEMARRDVDVLVVTSTPNISYLTGNRTRITALHAVVVSIHKEEPAFIVRRIDVPGGFHQTFLERDNVIGYPEKLIGNPDKNGFDAVIDYIHELGHANRGVGLEFGYLTAQASEKFKARLPKARIVDCTKAVDWIRMVKSDLEITVMREVAAISDAGMMRAAEVIRPGVREADAAAEIVGTLLRGAKGKPGTDMPAILMCSSPRTGTPHVQWSEDVFRDGSQINLEFGGRRHGYAVGIMRTFTIGAPSDRLRRLHEAEVAGLEAALDTVRPGRTCSDVANAFYRKLTSMGFEKDTRCGYPIGIDWTEPTASLNDGDMTELKPNMTFHLMLGNWIDEDFGYVISETFRVTDAGVEVLTSVPRKIFEL